MVVAYVGTHPETLVLMVPPAGALRAALRPPPTLLSDIIVKTPARTADQALGSMGRWQLPVEAMRAVPAAVETDVYRSLTVIPAVTFTTPLSARPLVRGYSAGESSFRIDGFEVVNLYHLDASFQHSPPKLPIRSL